MLLHWQQQNAVGCLQRASAVFELFGLNQTRSLVCWTPRQPTFCAGRLLSMRASLCSRRPRLKSDW